MNSFAEVIDALGIATCSEIFGITDSHVRTLKARDSIPANYFRRLVESEQGRAAHITFDLLHRLLDDAPTRRGASVGSELQTEAMPS